MLDRVANGDRERKEDDLRDGEERGAKHNVADRPAILERAEDEDELGDDINDGINKRPEDVDDPESERLRVVESGDLLERRNGDEERNSEYDERRYSQKLRAG